MFKIAKEFQFDACHMLDGHQGKCHNLHGHTYRLIVEVSSPQQPQGSSKEMVMDFADIKTIISQLDHAYLYDETNNNERKIAALLKQMQRKVFAFPCRTTTEGISRFIFNQLVAYLPVSKITLWETPTSYCEYQNNKP